MDEQTETNRIEIAQGAHLVDGAAWDHCAGQGNPFVTHAFFLCVEQSGCASRRTGWAPHHLLLRDGAGTLLGILPLYLKSHSQGEYVFDQGWAQAFERAGGDYYPKLQSSVPFTPVTGPRFLIAPEADRAEAERLLAAGAIGLARDNGLSSLHITFPTEGEWQRLGAAGFLQRTDRQFHWDNRDYQSFEDFLAALASRKRKQIRKERQQALADGEIEIHALTGDQLQTEHWLAFEQCYLATGAVKWGTPYLNRDFFARLHESLRHRVLLVMARRRGRWIAGALNLIGDDTLYGRNWGAIEDYPCLHFEVCYYQAIDFAIARGLARVEAGAQGEHKLARGYIPRTTHSLHWINDPGFRRAVADYLERERAAVSAEADDLADHAPYRHEEGA